MEQILAEPGPNVVDIVLDGYRVAGRVVDRDGNGVSAASLSIVEPGVMWRGVRPRQDGNFEIVDLPSGSHNLRVRSRDQTFAGREVPIHMGVTDIVDLEIVVSTGATVQGALIGLDHRDLQRVRVLAERPGESVRGAVEPGGRYRISGLSQGNWSVTARISAEGREARAAVALDDGDIVSLDLDFEEHDGSLSGIVLIGGGPFQQAVVTIIRDDAPVPRRAATNFEGRFSFTGLPAGTYLLEVKRRPNEVLHSRRIYVQGAERGGCRAAERKLGQLSQRTRPARLR